eukprot:12914399-Prorocentrum_lima.AAC.1
MTPAKSLRQRRCWAAAASSTAPRCVKFCRSAFGGHLSLASPQVIRPESFSFAGCFFQRSNFAAEVGQSSCA